MVLKYKTPAQRQLNITSQPKRRELTRENYEFLESIGLKPRYAVNARRDNASRER